MREWDEQKDDYPELFRRLTPEVLARLKAEEDEAIAESSAHHRDDVH
jgi:hypothetical protein